MGQQTRVVACSCRQSLPTLHTLSPTPAGELWFPLGVTESRPMSLTELPEIPGGWTSQTINLGPRSIQLTLPAVPDDFLDDPNVLKASRESDYMPYWAYLWPASTAMARLILSESWPEGTRALEIGCGVGLTGVAGLAAGLDLTFSDYDSTSV